jgi:tyrosine-specific transport protein
MKHIGAIMLVAGTAIGSGMLALPITLAKLGIIQSICLMLATSIITYYSALINLELHLQSESKHALSLGKLAKYFSGRTAELIGTLTLTLLSMALLAVFIYAGSSVAGKLIYYCSNQQWSFGELIFSYAFCSVIILILPLVITDYFNRFMFLALIFVTCSVIFRLATSIDWNIIPESNFSVNILMWSSALPLVFTSFGFQGSIPTIVDYSGKDQKALKKIFFWGSALPVVLYLLWTITVLLIIYQKNPAFFTKMTLHHVEVSDLIQQLSLASHWTSVKLVSWWISFFAILTSVIGVGIGLVSSLEQQLRRPLGRLGDGLLIYPLFAIVPAAIVAYKVPNAFITVLGFAGMLLAVIAILLPIFLLTKIYKSGKKFHYLELKNGVIPLLVLCFGIIIVVAEILNMYN